MSRNGISMNNSVNVYGKITIQGGGKNALIVSGYVSGGVANSNSVNISGRIHGEGNIDIVGGVVFINLEGPAVDAAADGNIVSISGKIFLVREL